MTNFINRPQESNSLVTIKDIAKLAVVSHMTVSRALNGSSAVTPQTRDKILAIAKEMNYTVNINAKSLVLRKKYSIGVVFSTLSPATAPTFVISCLKAIYQNLAQDYNMVIQDLEQNVDNFNFSRVDGIILISQQESDDYFIDLALKHHTKLVVINRRVKKPVINITVDEIMGAKTAVELLIKQGYQQIAHINGPCNIQSSRDRHNGYRQALYDAGIKTPRLYSQSASFSLAGGYEAMNKLLALPVIPDAVFCANDEIAIGALKVINEQTNLTTKIAVVGFNNSEISLYSNPTLTTIQKPILQMAERASQVLFELIEGKVIEPYTELLATQLIMRDSTPLKLPNVDEVIIPNDTLVI